MGDLVTEDPAAFASNLRSNGFTEQQTLLLTNELLVRPEKLLWRMREWSNGRSGSADNGADVEEEEEGTGPLVHRPLLQHATRAPPAPPFPRLSVRDLASGSAPMDFLTRSIPFVLTGAMEGWGALERWRDPAYFATLFGSSALSEFYAHNLLQRNHSPPEHISITRAAELLALSPSDEEVASPPTTAHRSMHLRGRYMHVVVGPEELRALQKAGDVPAVRHGLLRGDEWMESCLTESALRTEYVRKTHWQVLLIGSRGAGMHNHTDGLRTASWHAQAAGRKWWYVCKGVGRCFEGVLKPGEVLSYGDGWAHLTQNVDTPTVAMTGTVVHPTNHQLVAQRLRGECVMPASMQLQFSARLCDALDKCYQSWGANWAAAIGATPAPQWPPWRDVTDAATVRTKDAINPTAYPYVPVQGKPRRKRASSRRATRKRMQVQVDPFGR